MAFDPYKGVDTTKIAKLTFNSVLCNYVYASDSRGLLTGQVYKIDNTVYDQVKGILSGDPAVKPVKGDMVYVLPGHTLAHTRIKEHLKKMGANTTKDISKATIIAGTNSFEQFVNRRDQAKIANMMFWYDQIYNVEDVTGELDKTFSRLANSDANIQLKLETDYGHGVPTLVTKHAYDRCGYSGNLCVKPTYHLVTPVCMEIIYHVLSGKLKVMSNDTIANNANSGLNIEDESTYEMIMAMLDGGDKGNMKLAIEMLIYANLTGETVWNIYRISRAHYWEIVGHPTSKGLKHFLKETNFKNLGVMDEHDFLEYAKDGKFLTDKMVQELMPGIFEENCNACNEFNEDYFELVENPDKMSWTVQLKPIWAKHLKTKTDEPSLV